VLANPEARVSKQAAGSGIEEKHNISQSQLNHTVVVGDKIWETSKKIGRVGSIGVYMYQVWC